MRLSHHLERLLECSVWFFSHLEQNFCRCEMFVTEVSLQWKESCYALFSSSFFYLFLCQLYFFHKRLHYMFWVCKVAFYRREWIEVWRHGTLSSVHFSLCKHLPSLSTSVPVAISEISFYFQAIHVVQWYAQNRPGTRLNIVT